jgi:hypothetical protein
LGSPVWSGGGFFGVCRFLPPTPVPAFVRGFWRFPVLVVIVWWPRIEGYTHHLSAACVSGSVAGCLYECGCSPHGPRPPPSLQKRGRPRGSAGAPYFALEGPVASTVAHFLRSRVPAWGHGEESGRRTSLAGAVGGVWRIVCGLIIIVCCPTPLRGARR